EAILRPHRPIVGNGVFEAATDGPTNASARKAVEAEWARIVGIDASESSTAGGIEQGAVPGYAEAAADRTFDVLANPKKRIAKDWVWARCSPEIRPVHVAFNTHHPLGELQIIADMGAADHAVRIGAKRESRGEHRI